MNAEEGHCERRREWAVPRGLRVVYCWEAGTAWTGLSWKKINVWKNKHTPVHTNTHFCINTCINTNKKLATEHKEKESICMKSQSDLFSHGICSLLTHRTQTFLPTSHPENAAERYIRQQGWPETLCSRTGYHKKDRLYIIKNTSFLTFGNILEFAHWFKC